MHPQECPKDWDYQRHPNASDLPKRCAAILAALRRGNLKCSAVVRDTRPAHGKMFEGMTPDGFPYFAGHYRGERFRCLQHYEVEVSGDWRVGTLAVNVKEDLRQFVRIVREGIAALNAAYKIPHAQLPPEDKLYYVVIFACRVLVEFMRIHPYANGNGHMGRLVVWAVLGAYGIWPKRWPLHDRPPDPPYSTLLPLYRDGTPEPLERFVLQCVIG